MGGCGRQGQEHVLQSACDLDRGDGGAKLAIFDEKARRPPAVISGDRIDTVADQLGHIEALSDARHQLLWRKVARLHVEIGGPRARRAADAPAGVSGGPLAKLSGRCRIQQPAGQHAVVSSEEHTSELQSLMRISYAVFCLKTK